MIYERRRCKLYNFKGGNKFIVIKYVLDAAITTCQKKKRRIDYNTGCGNDKMKYGCETAKFDGSRHAWNCEALKICY